MTIPLWRSPARPGLTSEMAKLLNRTRHYEVGRCAAVVRSKANKLGQMVKANLPMVFQGLVVMPHNMSDTISIGRKGGSSNTTSRAVVMKSRITIPSDRAEKDAPTIRRSITGWASGNGDRPLRVGLLALFNAADEDVRTGGPDLVRGIFPLPDREPCPALPTCRRNRFARLTRPYSQSEGDPQSMPLPYYVSPEQMMQDKAEYAKRHRQRPFHHRAGICRWHRARGGQSQRVPAQGVGGV